jgi:hypothetical protein
MRHAEVIARGQGKGLHFVEKSGNIGRASFHLADFSRVDV